MKKPTRTITGLLPALCLLLCQLLCLPLLHASGEAPDVPNVIIFIADDVSWDDLGCYGNPQVSTPAIDRLARKGLTFHNAYLTASSCSPSRNSILLGRYPHNTGAAELHSKPPLLLPSIPAQLKEAGYLTLQSGKFHMGDFGRTAFAEIHDKGEQVGNSGSDMWLENVRQRPRQQPFFMWFASLDAHRSWGPNAYSGTHDPASLEVPFYLVQDARTQWDLARYYDEIHRFDQRIGEVTEELEKQGVLENTLIIVMADNGRPFPHSKTRVNDQGMKTPFILHWPARIKGDQHCHALLSVIDIAPTLMELAGIEAPASFQGRSFARLLTEPDQEFRHYLFAEHNWHDYEAHERMVRNKDYMYILNSRPNLPQMGPADAVGSPSWAALDSLRREGRLSPIQADVFLTPRPAEELYQPDRDPFQQLNLASVPEHEQALVELRQVLQSWMEQTGDNVPEQLTRSWFMHVPGYVRTPDHNIRGEMPGQATGAVHNNKPGPF